MTTKTQIGLVAALVLTSASSVLAAPRYNEPQAGFEGRATVNHYINKPCVTDEGYGRWLSCGAGAS